MTIEEKLDKLITSDDHVAYQLLFEDGGDWRETPKEYKNAFQKFKGTFESLVSRISHKFGAPSHIEREWSPSSPPWAPMGLYADWITNDQNDIICVFLGGDGNPEDPLILFAGRTTQKAKMESEDPWMWQWIE